MAGKDLGQRKILRRLPVKKEVGVVERVKNLPMYAKVGAALGLGAVVLLGTAAVIPVAVGTAGLVGYHYVRGRRYSSGMTPERIKVYEQALTLKDAKKLRVLADEFEKAGCLKEAEHLRKRAALRERSPAEKKADQQRYREAMAMTDSSKCEAEARYFESIGADGAAKNIRTRCGALRAVRS